MKKNTGMSRKLRYGGVTAVLTAAIIAIVIIVNVAFSALSQKFVWYTDLSTPLYFTLSEELIKTLKEGDESFADESLADGSVSPIEKVDEMRKEFKEAHPELSDEELKNHKDYPMINIILCDDAIEWTGDDLGMQWVWKTAADIQEKFKEYIKIEYVDIIRNPTRVSKYGSEIAPDDVIIECGDEFRVRSLQNFYMFDTDGTTAWAYNGEKIFAACIMSVTRSSSPLALFTIGHGEEKNADITAQAQVLANAGYEVDTIDLSKVSDTNPIPEDCRLIIVSSPETDFLEPDGKNNIDETKVIEDFLDNGNSLMVLMSHKVNYRLNNLEDLLEEWGIKFVRDKNDTPYRIQDLENSFDKDNGGFTIGGSYVNYELGSDFAENSSNAARVVFPNAIPVTYASDNASFSYLYTDDKIKGEYGYMSADGTNRYVYPIFTASKDAKPHINGSAVDDLRKLGIAGDVMNLMMVSAEDTLIQEDNNLGQVMAQTSYVLACGCPDMFSTEMLSGMYGNSAFLESTLRVLGHEPVPVSVGYRAFAKEDIDGEDLSTAKAAWIVVILTVVPAVVATGTGIFVIVRRKNR